MVIGHVGIALPASIPETLQVQGSMSHACMKMWGISLGLNVQNIYFVIMDWTQFFIAVFLSHSCLIYVAIDVSLSVSFMRIKSSCIQLI